METRVNIHPYQAVPSTEMNAIQGFVQSSVDAIVKELLFDEPRFTGLTVSRASALEVEVAKGRLYRAGAVYPSTVVRNLSLASFVPASGSRIALVVVSGDKVLTGEKSVKFLIDATTRQVQPRPVATREARQASVELVVGAASASPSRPALPAGAIAVAWLRLGPTGIVDGPDMEVANSAISLEKAMVTIALLQAQDKKTASLFNTIRSEIAALAKAQKSFARDAEIEGVLVDLLKIKELLDIPDTASFNGYDDFGTDDETDHGLSTALLETGFVRMGAIERTSKLAALFNPNDSRLDISETGLILPKSSDVLRIEVDDRDSEVAIASYTQSDVISVKKTLTRRYILHDTKGETREAVEKRLKSKPTIRLLNPQTDAWETIDFSKVTWAFKPEREKRYSTCELDITSPYWEVGQSNVTVRGARVAQTFLCAQGGWHKRVDLGFTDVAGVGDVHVHIRKVTDNATPDPKQTIATTTILAAQLKRWPTWTPALFDPFFLERGERYAIELVTTGDHKIGVSASNDLTNGTFMVCTDGAYWSGDLAKDMLFRLYGCRFDASRVLIDMEDITLAGGIREFQAALTGFTPDGADIVVEARVAGVWRAMGEESATIFASAPTQLPLRLVFVGTKDLMPAVDLSKSRFIASRPRTPSVHMSTARTLPDGATATKVTVVEEARAFDAAKHGWTVQLMTGAGYVTTVEPTSVKTQDRGRDIWRRAWTFSGLPAIAAYRIKTTLATSDVADVFSLRSRQDFAE